MNGDAFVCKQQARRKANANLATSHGLKHGIRGRKQPNSLAGNNGVAERKSPSVFFSTG